MSALIESSILANTSSAWRIAEYSSELAFNQRSEPKESVLDSVSKLQRILFCSTLRYWYDYGKYRLSSPLQRLTHIDSLEIIVDVFDST